MFEKTETQKIIEKYQLERLEIKKNLEKKLQEIKKNHEFKVKKLNNELNHLLGIINQIN